MNEDNDDAKDIVNLINNRKKQYSNAQATLILVPNEDRWELSCGDIILQMDKENEEFDYNYERVRLVRKNLTIEEATSFISSLQTEDTKLIGDIEFKSKKIDIDYDYDYPSYEKTSRINWSITIYTGKYDREVRIPYDKLVHPSLPFFPDTRTAYQNFIGLGWGQHSLGKGIIIFLPDYRARIEGIRILADKLIPEIKVEKIKEEDIIGKYMINKTDTGMQYGDLEFNIDDCFIPYDENIDSLWIALIDRNSGELIDWVSFGQHFDPKIQVSFEIFEEEIRHAIKRGESPTIELKQEISNTIVKTAVAFANTEGGQIIIGVDDDGNILGLKGLKIKEQLQNKLANLAEPLIKYEIKKIELDEEPIYILSISEGDNKPYLYNGKYYIRRGSSCRIAKRYDLDHIYEQKYGNINEPRRRYG